MSPSGTDGNASEAVKKLAKGRKRKICPLIINDLRKRFLAIFNFFTASQSWVVGRALRARRGGQRFPRTENAPCAHEPQRSSSPSPPQTCGGEGRGEEASSGRRILAPPPLGGTNPSPCPSPRCAGRGNRQVALWWYQDGPPSGFMGRTARPTFFPAATDTLPRATLPSRRATGPVAARRRLRLYSQHPFSRRRLLCSQSECGRHAILPFLAQRHPFFGFICLHQPSLDRVMAGEVPEMLDNK